MAKKGKIPPQFLAHIKKKGAKSAKKAKSVKK